MSNYYKFPNKKGKIKTDFHKSNIILKSIYLCGIFLFFDTLLIILLMFTLKIALIALIFWILKIIWCNVFRYFCNKCHPHTHFDISFQWFLLIWNVVFYYFVSRIYQKSITIAKTVSQKNFIFYTAYSSPDLITFQEVLPIWK